MSIVVFIGFGPSFYLTGLMAAPPGMGPVGILPTLIVAHALVFTAWMVMVMVQTGLAARGWTHLHRQFGVAGAILAGLVVVFGTAAQFSSVRRAVLSGAYDDSAFLQSVALGGFITITLFAGLVAAAICMRRHPETHKRLMLLATITLLGAATSRIGRIVELALPAAGPLPFLGLALTNCFLLVLVVHDWRTSRRLHSATVAGCILVIALQILSSGPLPHYPPVLQFVRWLVG